MKNIFWILALGIAVLLSCPKTWAAQKPSTLKSYQPIQTSDQNSCPQGCKGAKGDKGDKGDTGPAGPIGPQGPAGGAASNVYLSQVKNDFDCYLMPLPQGFNGGYGGSPPPNVLAQVCLNPNNQLVTPSCGADIQIGSWVVYKDDGSNGQIIGVTTMANAKDEDPSGWTKQWSGKAVSIAVCVKK